MIKDRQSEIRSRSLNLVGRGVSYNLHDEEIPDDYNEEDFLEFSKIRVGLKQLDDATLNLGTYRKVNPRYGDKNFVLRAIYNHDYKTLREISDYFYEASGIYYRLCRYLAFLYRYDWVITPLTVDDKNENKNKELKDFASVLSYLDRSEVKRVAGDVALDVMRYGVYYALIID